MSDFEFIDLFPQSGKSEQQRENSPENYDFNTGYDSSYYQQEYNDQNMERIRINDFKHSPNSIRKGNGNMSDDTYYQQPDRNQSKSVQPEKPVKKASSGVSDDKFVWAGALFVFFGVFVFLIGYWLGKTSDASLTETSSERSQVERALEEAELDTVFASNIEDYNNSADDWVLGSSQDLEETPEAEPVEPIVAPPVITTSSSTDDSDDEEEISSTASEDTVSASVSTTENASSTSTAATATDDEDDEDDEVDSSSATTTETSEIGNYTIQVSAHTSMDSARIIEQDLRDEGYQSYVVESIVNGTRYFRVRVGSFTIMREAKSALADLQDMDIGIDAYIIDLD